MAISQSKYIRITTDSSTTGLRGRSFQGLVFTATAMVSGAPSDMKTAYETNKDIVGLGFSDVAKCFGESSDEYKFAVRYFGYLALNGTSPTTLNFIKVQTSETPATALARANDSTNNFGSFTFLNTAAKTWQDTELVAASEINTGYDHKYLMVQCYEYDSTANASTIMAKYKSSVATAIYFGNDKYGAAAIMAPVASIDFNGRDSTICLMFKQIPGEVPVITNDTDFESMKAIDANFYGLTQTNGTQFAFLQTGYCSNHEDIGVCVNEMWLKSAIATEFMRLYISVNKVPANTTGVAMLKTVIAPVVDTAIQNGTILPNKDITDSDRIAIHNFTGSNTAAEDVATVGYWLGVKIEKNSDGDYEAYYYLPYSKGDAIRFCSGHHKLV